jgi:hypothetical protein
MNCGSFALNMVETRENVATILCFEIELKFIFLGIFTLTLLYLFFLVGF